MNPHKPGGVNTKHADYNMNKKLLKTSVNKTWALVLRASQQVDLNFKQQKELYLALNAIRDNWPENDSYNGKANWMYELVSMSGILSIPPRKPKDMEVIMQYCQLLLHYLDSD